MQLWQIWSKSHSVHNQKQANGNHKSPVKKNGKYKKGNGTNHFKNGNQSNNYCDNNKKSGNRRSNKDAWKTQPPNNTELDKCIGQNPVYKKKVNGKVFQWCQECGKNGKWGLSHNTTTHQDDFKHEKNGNNHKHSVQVNILEGLVPDARLWLAQFHHPKHRLRGRSWTKRLTKLFGRRLKCKKMLNNHIIKVNKWYPVDCSVPPPDPRPANIPTTDSWMVSQ